MQIERIAKLCLSVGVGCLVLGLIRFLGAVDPNFGAAWPCFFTPALECHVVMPSYSPTLAQCGSLAWLVGAVLYVLAGLKDDPNG